MKYNFTKKAEMSLEALLGIILSIMGMVVLITIFSNILFTSQPNQIVSQNTVDSFHDYVSFSQQSTYQNIGSCFTIFKIEQLTNYQRDENEDKNYFFVITSEYVGQVKFKHLNKFQNLEDDAYQYIEQRQYFSQPLEIKIDKTQEESQFIQGLTFGIGGNSDVELVFEEKSPELLLLLPTFDNQKKFEVIIPELLETRSIQGKDTYTIQEDDFLNSYLAFSPSSNFLFAPKNKMSHFYVQQNLCLKKKRIADYISSITLDEMYNLAHTQYHIIFEITPQTPYSFEWNQGPICKNNGTIISCDQVLSNDDLSYESNDDLSYEKFLDEIQSYLRTLEGDVSFGIKKYIPLQEYFDDNSVLSDLFTVSNEITLSNYFTLDTSSRSSAADKHIILPQYNEFYFQEDVNNLFVNLEYDFLIYKNNKVYFLLDDVSSDNLVSFNSKYVKSYKTSAENYIYFFNNQEIELGDVDFINNNIVLQVYKFTVEVDDEEIQVLLSNEQLREIQSRAQDASVTFIESSQYALLEFFEPTQSSANQGFRIKEEFLDEAFYEQGFVSNQDKLAKNVYFFEDDELYFYENIVNRLRFISFNHDLLRVETTTKKHYFYFNEEIEFYTKTIEPFSQDEDILIHCFTLRKEVLEQELEGRGGRDIEICMSEYQYNSIGGNQQ